MEEAFIKKKQNCVHKLTKFFFLLVITYNISYYYTLRLFFFLYQKSYVKKLACIFSCKPLFIQCLMFQSAMFNALLRNLQMRWNR